VLVALALSLPAPIATVMRRFLTRYAVTFNRRHGQLFQNRYKPILCQKDACLLELARYIHMNPLKAKIVQELRKLDRYPYSGHSVVMGKGQNGFIFTSLNAVFHKYGPIIQTYLQETAHG
jgi:hypothetical protein